VFDSFGARHGRDQPVFLLNDVRAFEAINCHEIKDIKLTDVDFQTL
jgi:hypothetical protein